ncbi:MAG TPA: SDR family NAD(P)-dependent oxidoreductase [Solimonas sp.]|nr:SDR family NAD(P)-dependent oxidoreductase [Solimonas sp.]
MNQSCLVVGAGPGIGQAVAQAFALEGLDVALMSRNPAKLADACSEIRKSTGRQARAYTADAGNDASLRATLAKASKDLGEPEVLVFNAATSQMGKPTTIPTERLLAEFQANVAGALTCAKAVAPGMVERRRGTILFTGGGFAYEPAAEYASLSLCKAALRSLTYTLAQELGMYGVHVATVTVHGFVQTGTKFDPHQIAGSFVQLHRQPKGHFDIELIYK